MSETKTRKTHTSYRMSPTARELLAKLAEQDGGSRTATLERLIRQEARKRGVGV